jgi:hypothetical protein
MEGMSASRELRFDVFGIRVVVTRMPGEPLDGSAYAARLCRDGDVARGRLVRHGNACCLEVTSAPDWLHQHCAVPVPGYARGVTDGDTVWLEVPPLVRAEVVLPWMEHHRHELRPVSRIA